jgi:SAM-dependent methyltransferase
MNEIVHAHLPGVSVVHLPTPPPQIRAITDHVYFDRLVSVMFDPALASESVDYVFCCEVLHHNDRANLRRTMDELYRVLRPGGKLLVINEPLRFLFNLKRDHGLEVAEFEGHEHVFFCHQYYRAARQAGFEVTLQEPATEPFFEPWSATLEPQTSIRDAVHNVLVHSARRHPVGRRLVLAYKTLLRGDVSLNMIATKPSRAERGRGASPTVDASETDYLPASGIGKAS